MENKKLTKKQLFAMIKEETNNPVIIEFCDKEIELLEKKSSRKTPTKAQKENEITKEIIIDVLLEGPKSIKELQSSNEVLSELSCQKISALLTQLKKNGQVVRKQEGREVLFEKAED